MCDQVVSRVILLNKMDRGKEEEEQKREFQNITQADLPEETSHFF